MHTAHFKSSIPLVSSKVDIEAGIIRDVALMQVGTAHGSIDGKPMATEVTLDSLKAMYAILKDAPKKSHILHGDDHAPCNAIGIFSGFYIDMESEPVTLRASQFEAFKAFRENSKKEFETMFELAATSPKDMAMSADFDLDLEKRDGLPPVIVPLSVRSFDFVNQGAATLGLFSVDKPPASSQPLNCNETTSQQAASTSNTISKMKAVFAHFAANPKALPFIAKFAAEADDKATDADIIAKVEGALSDEEQAALVAERDELKAKLEAAEAKIAELTPKADKEAELSKKVTELEGKVAQFEKRTGRFGAPPVKIGAPEGSEAKTITRAEFKKLSVPEQNAHMAGGGKLSE